MPVRDQIQINYLFATTALSVGMSLGVGLSHAFWRMDYLMIGSGTETENAFDSADALKSREHLAEETSPSLDLVTFRDKILLYDGLDSVLEASNRMGRLFDKVPDSAIPVALGLLEEIETRMAKRRAVEVLFSRWADIDPAAALDAAEMMESRMSKEVGQSAVLSIWLKRQPEGALHYLAEVPEGSARVRLLRHAVEYLSDYDPGKAVALLVSSEDSMMKLRRLPRLAKDWGRMDPNVALAWAGRQFSDADDRATFVAEVIHGWALERPEEALEYVRAQSKNGSEEGINVGERTHQLLVEVLRGWASENPVAAAQYIFKFDSEDEQLPLLHAIAKTLSAADPKTILGWTTAFRGEERETVLAQLIEHKLEDDPASAARLVLQLPEGALQQTVLADVAEAWAARDAPGASEWLKSLDPSPARDAAVVSFVDSIFVSDALVAMDWALSVSDNQKRSEMLTALLERWLLSNPSAAEQWFAENSEEIGR